MPIEPRPLNDSERAVLEHLLEADFAGAPALRGQLDRTEVVATWGTGSVSVLPAGAGVYDRCGEYIGELLLWAEGGTTLSALEYAWVTAEMPTSLPSVDQLQ
ncbi:hypothetical protein ASE03_32410 [Kitasatospora sp. Root187]|nr:hypothetical protein ASC99_29385 [Kitasatospora sp. Root107]KRB65085.1 hypothetical protein ASE03_32410 [Kitasatospora sp. Root187]